MESCSGHVTVGIVLSWVIWHPAGIFRMGLTWVCQPLFQDVSANINGSCMNTELYINVST